MSLTKQTITLDFGLGGMDQKSDPKRIMPIRFSELGDAAFTKTGRIERRRAMNSYATSATPLRLFALENQLMAASQTAGQRAFVSRIAGSYTSSVTTLDTFGTRYVDSLPFAEVTTEARGPARNIAISSTFVSWSRVESNSCVAISYYSDNGAAPGHFVEIYDKAGGGLLRSFSLNTSQGATYILSHPDGRDEFVVAHKGNSTSITAYIVTPSSTTLVYAATVSLTGAGSGGGAGWAIATVADATASSSAVIAVASTNFSNELRFKSSNWPSTDGTGTTISFTAIPTSSAVTVMSLASFADPTTPRDFRFTFCYSATTIVSGTLNRSMTYQLAFATVFNTTATPNQLAAVVLGDGSAHVWQGGSTQGILSVYAIDSANTATIVKSNVGGYLVNQLLTAPMGVSSTVGGTSVAWCARTVTTNQASAYLVAAYQAETTSEVKARAFHLRSWDVANQFNRPCNAQWSVTDKCVVTSLQRLNRSSTLTGGDSSAGDWGLYDVRAKPSNDGWNVTRWKNELVVTGGYGFAINGIDAPIPTSPLTLPTITLVSVTSSGGALTAGSYQVSGFYEYTDNQGTVRRSETAEPLTVTLSGTQVAFSVAVSNYTIPDGLPGRARFVATRTLVNESQVYYRDISYSTTSTTSSIAVSFTVSDATLSAREPMYTAGGVYDDGAASCLLACATNGRRMLAVFGDDPNFVAEGKPNSGAFMEGVGRRIDAGGKRIYALASYLDRWFAFKKDGIYVATGDGSDARGQNETLSEFETLVTGLGCTKPRSVLVTSVGIVFLSDRGFYLIGSDLAPRYIGADVETFELKKKINAQNLLDACYDSVGSYGDFLGSTEEASGRTGERCVFAFDGSDGAGSYDALTLTIVANAGGIDLRWAERYFEASSVASIGGRLIGSNGTTISRESDEDSSDEYRSSVDSPSMIATTAWAPLGQLQGLGRVYKSSIVGAVGNTSITVTVAVGYDYSQNWSETHTVSTANMVNGQFEFGHQRTRCEAVRYRITQDSVTSSYGYALNQIQVTVGVKKTTNDLPASARARKS